jgi:hypothetical protein
MAMAMASMVCHNMVMVLALANDTANRKAKQHQNPTPNHFNYVIVIRCVCEIDDKRFRPRPAIRTCPTLKNMPAGSQILQIVGR